MADQLDIRQYFHKIEEAPSHEDQIIKMIQGVMDLFPLQDAYFFRYSSIGYLGEGVFYTDRYGKIRTLKNVKDDLRSLPTILAAVKNRKATYITNKSYITHSKNFASDPLVPSMIILPICKSANVIGYIISTKFKENIEIDELLLDSLTYYGKKFGKLLEQEYNYYPITNLTKREIEAMQLLAYGNSLKEIAEMMSISIYTVQDYIKAAVKKTKALNRLHAVVILMRKGILS